jgi:hypothetical protein
MFIQLVCNCQYSVTVHSSQGALDSDDSEEDDHVVLRKVLHKKNVIESDDED